MHGSGFEDVVLRDAGFDGRANFRNSYPPLFIATSVSELTNYSTNATVHGSILYIKKCIF